MPINFLVDRPILFFVWVLVILLSLSVHEFSHAVAGEALGDHTAREARRLTLNPLAHIDPLGFVMLLFVGFGWGKPVPFNPYNLKYPRWGPTLVAFAGPLANLLNVILAGIALKLILTYTQLPFDNLLVQFLGLLVLVNLILMLFNLIPLPPLDGSKFLLSLLAGPQYARIRFLLETRGPMLLLLLIVLDNIFGINIFGRLFSSILRAVFQFF